MKTYDAIQSSATKRSAGTVVPHMASLLAFLLFSSQVSAQDSSLDASTVSSTLSVFVNDLASATSQERTAPWHASYGSPPGVIRNKVLSSAFIPFADPESKIEAIFTTNAQTDRGGADAISRSLAIRGYTRDFYRNLSIVNLQFGCLAIARENVNIRLNAIRDGVFETPVAHFNRIYLPKSFVLKINERIRFQQEKNPIPGWNQFVPPGASYGAQGRENNNQ